MNILIVQLNQSVCTTTIITLYSMHELQMCYISVTTCDLITIVLVCFTGYVFSFVQTKQSCYDILFFYQLFYFFILCSGFAYASQWVFLMNLLRIILICASCKLAAIILCKQFLQISWAETTQNDGKILQDSLSKCACMPEMPNVTENPNLSYIQRSFVLCHSPVLTNKR